ncbi:MAG TPA: ABC transporter permease [Chloroflexi bacterium]|nr:ABC transporter permease [Chloroflexota bacterium]
MKSLSNSMRIFLGGAVLSYKALFRWFRLEPYIATKIIAPLNQILFFTLLGSFATGRDTASFYAIGNAIQLTAMSGIYGVTMSIGGERNEGTLIYLFGSPANRLLTFLGRALVHILDGMIGVVIGLTWTGLLLGVDFSRADLPALGLTILIATVSTSGLGLLMGCVSLVTVNVMFINNTIYFLLLVFSGANVPLANFPTWVQHAAYALPLTRGIQAARLVISGSSLGEVAPLLTGEALIGVVYVLIGYVLFSWFEVTAKRRGTLEAY